MDKVASERKLEVNGEVHSESHFAATVDWNLVAVQLFFCTGHRFVFLILFSVDTYSQPQIYTTRGGEYCVHIVGQSCSTMFLSLANP
jgi:hypothetical protein